MYVHVVLIESMELFLFTKVTNQNLILYSKSQENTTIIQNMWD